MKVLKALLFIVFCYTNSFSQIDNFTLTVTHTNETCTANGTLSFSVSNILPGATILYSIYRFPNLTTPITVTNISPFAGLTAGIYRVIATQSFGSQSASKQKDVTIINQIVALSYQLTSTKEICGADGTITVTTTTGVAVEYEIISGPIIKPLQNSNVFTGLSAGLYDIRVFDVCGEAIVQTFTLEYANPALLYTLIPATLTNCTTVKIGFSFDNVFPTGTIKYPLQVTTVVNPPSSPAITAISTINGGLIFQSLFELYTPQPYSYSFTIVDACGNSQTINGIINNLNASSSYLLDDLDCTHKKITFNGVIDVVLVTAPPTFSSTLPINYSSQIVNNEVSIVNLTTGTYVFNVTDFCGVVHVYTINVEINSALDPYILLFNRTCISSSLLVFGVQQLIMTSAPASYNVLLPHDYTILINSANYAAFNNLPIGVYQFSTIDMCGQPKPLTVVINPIFESPSVTVLEGCEVGIGGILLSGQITSVKLTSAPSSYTNFSLPHDFTSSLLNNSTLVLGMLPSGTYVFTTLDSCNIQYTLTAIVLGYQENTTATITPNCGSFTLNLVPNSNSSNNTYWLQKWNPIANLWVHPSTNIPYTDGTFPTTTNSVSLNTGITLNLTYIGQFRIIKGYKTYIDNITIPINCYKVLKEFEFSGQPKIIGVNSISCGAAFEVIVDAEGIGDLIYRITLKNGLPFVVQNGNSSYFTNLQPAVYSFQVEDICGNIVNRVFEIINPLPFIIYSEPVLCNGQNVTLTVPNFSFLEYHWLKDNQTSNILSTSNTLNIPTFDNTIHNGLYSVNIVYPNNPNSCLNQILTYTINFQPDVPNAGAGKSISYCGNQATIDLFSLLDGSYDTDGTWSEVTNSGTLTNNIWNSSTVAFGTYQFKYRAEGNCNLFSEAFVNITLFAIPNAPIASVEAIICETSDIQLYASTIVNGNYVWTGPNGFSSTEQNPTLTNVSATNNGTYSVYVSQNNCQSEVSEIEVVVNPLPDFGMTQECLNKEYVLTAIINPEVNVTFNWTGPNGYSNNQNPITITRAETGSYSLTITNQNGCFASKAIDVLRTFCEIPNVITPNNDGSNEELDLSGFDVKELEIYNRWGRLVFDQTNYTNEWRGQSNKGERLPDGTYFYLITYDNLETINGWIFLSGN